MKRIKLTFLMSVLSVCSMMALPYSTASREALFLTDKMAYELNLSYDQYDYVYQVNLDYFLNINSAYDCTGKYWKYRNLDLGCILHDWQYALYKATSYFFTPIKWVHSAWHHCVYDHYHHGLHYFKKPKCYSSYRGSNWHNRKHHAHSPYSHHKAKPGLGMRDKYYKNGKPADKHHPSAHRPGNRNDKGRPGANHKTDRPQTERPSYDRPHKSERPQTSTSTRTPQRTNTKAQRPQRSTTSKPASRGTSDRGNNRRDFGR